MKVSRFLVGLAMVVGLVALCMPEINEGQRRGKRGDKSAASKPAPESTMAPVPEPDMKMPGSGKVEMLEKESKKAAARWLLGEGRRVVRSRRRRASAMISGAATM